MVLKWFRPAAVMAVGVVLVGFFLFGDSFFSYLKTSRRVVQAGGSGQACRSSLSCSGRETWWTRFLPQLQANVRLIAEEEVEIASLENDIAESSESLENKQIELSRLRDKMQIEQVSYHVGGREWSRTHLAEQLAMRFARYRDDELLLQGKRQLLETRRESLRNAMQMHERAKHQKLQLEQKIESLVAQHRLVQSTSVGTQVAVDGSQLNRVDQLLAQIQRRLNVSQRVLAHESDLHEIQLTDQQVDEAALLAEFDEHFGGDTSANGEQAGESLAVHQ